MTVTPITKDAIQEAMANGQKLAKADAVILQAQAALSSIYPHRESSDSAMTPLGAMQQSLADITAASGFTHLRALPIEKVLIRKP